MVDGSADDFLGVTPYTGPVDVSTVPACRLYRAHAMVNFNALPSIFSTHPLLHFTGSGSRYASIAFDAATRMRTKGEVRFNANAPLAIPAAASIDFNAITRVIDPQYQFGIIAFDAVFVKQFKTVEVATVNFNARTSQSGANGLATIVFNGVMGKVPPKVSEPLLHFDGESALPGDFGTPEIDFDADAPLTLGKPAPDVLFWAVSNLITAPTPGSACASAGTLPLGVPCTYTISGITPQWFKFAITGGTQYHVKITTNSGTPNNGIVETGTSCSGLSTQGTCDTFTPCIAFSSNSGGNCYVHVSASLMGSWNYTIIADTGPCP